MSTPLPASKSKKPDLPTGDAETFIGEHEEMYLGDLADKVFLVALNQGERDHISFLCGTLRGPFDFYGMVETVATIWSEYNVHAHVIIGHQDLKKPPQLLDECTIDYIEANYDTILMDGLVSDDLEGDKDYTCRAGILEWVEEQESDEKTI